MRKHGARNEGLPREILVCKESDGIADGTVDTGLEKLSLHPPARRHIALAQPLLAMTPSVPLRSEEIGDYPATSPLLLQKEADD
jgi:hypothetical protein